MIEHSPSILWGIIGLIFAGLTATFAIWAFTYILKGEVAIRSAGLDGVGLVTGIVIAFTFVTLIILTFVAYSFGVILS